MVGQTSDAQAMVATTYETDVVRGQLRVAVRFAMPNRRRDAMTRGWWDEPQSVSMGHVAVMGRPFQIRDMVVGLDGIAMIDLMSGGRARADKGFSNQDMNEDLDSTAVNPETDVEVTRASPARFQDAAGVGLVSRGCTPHSTKAGNLVALIAFNNAPFFDIVNRHRHGPNLRGGVGGPAAADTARARCIVGRWN